MFRHRPLRILCGSFVHYREKPTLDFGNSAEMPVFCKSMNVEAFGGKSKPVTGVGRFTDFCSVVAFLRESILLNFFKLTLS